MDYIFINGFKDFDYSLKTETFNFLAGEVHVKIHDKLNKKLVHENPEVTIFALANNSDDIMRILLTNDALKRLGYTSITLFMPYTPYSRQDKVMVEGEPFSLYVFTSILKTCKFHRICVFDPHSDITPTLLEDNIIVISNKEFVFHCLRDIMVNNGLTIHANYDKFTNSENCPVFISPDSGAFKKIFKLASELNYQKEIVLCNKARNLSDGKIMAYSVDKSDLQGRDCVIIDDICSKGGTFIALATELKKRNAGKIYLIVSHYEGSADIELLKQSGIEMVYTTPSIGKVTKEQSHFIKEIKFNDFIKYLYY